MTEKQAINRHIAECKHRINNIQNFIENNQNADIKVCTDNIFILEVAIRALKEIRQYRAIGTVEECRAAVEKTELKEPIDRCMFQECPTCGNVEIQYCKHCPDCGQALNLSKGE